MLYIAYTPPLPKITMSFERNLLISNKTEDGKKVDRKRFSFPIHFGDDRKPV